jgi:hypothetical protein
MGNRDAIDGKLDTIGFGKMEEAADVVVLVKGGKDALGFSGGKLEGGKRGGLAKPADEGEVE